MQPIGPLMIEHRLIERMIALMQREWQRITDNVAVDPEFAFVDPVFIDTAVDFIRTYADRCHHGKEEDILFRALKDKPLSSEHRRIMEELVEDHKLGRKITLSLLEANERHKKGDAAALSAIADGFRSLVEFYPKHIEKEDKHFFIPCMDYFTDAEKEAMLKEEWEFDRSLIHEKYRNIVISAEKFLTAKKL